MPNYRVALNGIEWEDVLDETLPEWAEGVVSADNADDALLAFTMMMEEDAAQPIYGVSSKVVTEVRPYRVTVRGIQWDIDNADKLPKHSEGIMMGSSALDASMRFVNDLEEREDVAIYDSEDVRAEELL